MNGKGITLYIVMIGLPGLLLGLAGLRMIENERTHLSGAAIDAASLAASQLADRVRETVSSVESEVISAIGNSADDGVNAAAYLRETAETNPFVRNAFLWSETNGVILPEQKSATADEKAFLARYAKLFSGDVPWAAAEETPYRSGRRDRNRGKPMSGRIPWFDGNQLFIVTWTSHDGGRTVRGVEIETSALLSKLQSVFGGLPESGYSFTVENGFGDPVITTAAITSDDAVVRIPLSPELPHWNLAVYGSGFGGYSARVSLAIRSLFLLLLFMSVSGGVVLLYRDASRQRLDAIRKTGFVSNVSHELKTPLTNIRMYAELLEEDRVSDSQKKKKFLGIIVSESRRLSRLVNNVLDFSRLEHGRRKYAPTVIDVSEFVCETADAMKETAADRGLEILISGGDAGLTVNADRDALAQVLVNLLDNAAKYASSGKTAVIGYGRNEAGGVYISVSDSGPGIPPQNAKSIFERFYRADSSAASGTSGCGLGLSIARLLMRGMNGDLTYSPGQSAGSVFTMVMP